MIKVTLEQLKPMLIRQLRAGIVPYIHGKPGIGKSALTAWIAEQLNLELIDIRLAEMDPCEIQGFPRINPETKKAEYVPLNIFPTTDWKLPEGKHGWLILFDEFSSAPKAVQAAAYKILLDRKLGQHKLHKNVAMMAAGNLSTDGAIVEPQSSAITSRTANVELLEDADGWCSWATANNIDHRITSYIRFKPDLIHTLDPEQPEEPYACARTWVAVSKCILDKQLTRNDDHALIASLVGEGVASEFLEFTTIYKDIPSYNEIVKDPKGIRFADRMDIRWALMGSVCQHITEETFESATEFLDRLPAELRVVALRELFRRKPHLYDLPVSQEWRNRVADEIF